MLPQFDPGFTGHGFLVNVGLELLSAIFTFIGAWALIRTELNNNRKLRAYQEREERQRILKAAWAELNLNVVAVKRMGEPPNIVHPLSRTALDRAIYQLPEVSNDFYVYELIIAASSEINRFNTPAVQSKDVSIDPRNVLNNAALAIDGLRQGGDS